MSESLKGKQHLPCQPHIYYARIPGDGDRPAGFAIIEQRYNDAKKWELDSIEQEQRNCYLYEKVGYKRTEETKRINNKLTLVFYEKYMD